MVASGGAPSEGYGHGGPGVCLSDDQIQAEGVRSQGGLSDALLRRMPPLSWRALWRTMVRAQLNELSQRTGPMSSAELFTYIGGNPVDSSEVRPGPFKRSAIVPHWLNT